MSTQAPATPAPLQGIALAVVAVALSLGTFMQVLDSTIANVSLPTIAGNLGKSSDEAIWVITAFAAANGVTVPLTGWLMRRFGLVNTFIASVALFTCASFLCGIAWSLPSLVVFRLLQGAVSGPMIPGSQALLIATFPPEKRPVALGIWSMTALVGPILGPIMGGYISDNFHWGWIFLINVPVGLIAVTIMLAKLRGYNTPAVKLPVDIGGLVLLIIWVASLQVMLDLGKNADWFNSTLICVLAAVAAVGFVAWVIWELTEENPIVDLTLFAGRNFAIGAGCFCLGYAFFFAANLLMPQWLQQEQGYTATWAGLVAAPAGAVAVVVTPVMARFGSRLDMRLTGSLAFTAYAVSYLLRTRYAAQTDVWHYIVPILVQGLAMGTFFLSLSGILLDRLPPSRIPSATGLSNFCRITVAAFSASITTTIWDRREALHQSRLAESATPDHPAYQAAIHALSATGMTGAQANGVLNRQIVNQAYLLSSIDIFWFCGVACLVVVGAIWFARRPLNANAAPVVD